MRALRVVGLLALVAILLALPLLLATYPITLASRILAFALLVVSVDLLTGLTGLPTLGQIAYFGIGAYSAGLVGIHWTTNLFAQLGVGIAVAAAAAVVTGAVAVRTSGIVFLMVTLAIGELTHRLADGLDLVGASNGLAGIPAPTLLPGGEPLLLAAYTYWWVLAVFLLGLGVALLVSRSPLGRSMRAVRESPSRVAAIGQSTYSVKLLAYVVAGGLAGAAGTAFTAQTRFVAPGDLAFAVSAIALLSVVLGGAGTLWGPVIGAAVVILVRDWLSGYAAGHGELMLGILFVVAVFLLPRGFAGAVPKLPYRGPSRRVEGAAR
jgi:branched-chain amino acid transport system permease protein